MGPLRTDGRGRLLRNNDTWNSDFGMLFVDNPVGTGFSFVGSPSKPPSPVGPPSRDAPDAKTMRIDSQEADEAASLGSSEPCASTIAGAHRRGVDTADPPRFVDGFAANQAAVAHDLIAFLDRFYDLFPEQRHAPLYIAGESFAGKYLPHLAWHIDHVNAERAVQNRLESSMAGEDKSRHVQVVDHAAGLSEEQLAASSTLLAPAPIPLSGIMIGNGLTDPASQIAYHAPLALALGLVSRAQASEIAQLAATAVGFICQGEWRKSLALRSRMFDYFFNVTGGINWYDVRKGDVPNDWSAMNAFLQLPETKASLNLAPDAVFSKDPRVYRHLEEDIMRSAAGIVASLLEKQYRVLLYQGQFDFRDGIMGSSEWIENMQWHGADGFRAAERRVWRTATKSGDTALHVAGYTRHFEALSRVELLHAGHLAPMDQGPASKRMVQDWIASRGPFAE
nr:hypothetical protein HK105_003689 [Polyrhizophydium stewartii]